MALKIISLVLLLTELLGIYCGKNEETVSTPSISVEVFLDKRKHAQVLNQITPQSGILELPTSPFLLSIIFIVEFL